MLVAACFGSNDLTAAGQFYDAVLSLVDMTRLVTEEAELGYGLKDGETSFWVLRPFNKQPATIGNGSQIMFRAASPAIVDEFHATTLRLGGTDEGAPGPRDYAEGYYGAYCRDLDGNKLHVFCIDA